MQFVKAGVALRRKTIAMDTLVQVRVSRHLGDANIIRCPSIVTNPNSRIPHASSRIDLQTFAPKAHTDA